jgi:hypothetical protein
VPGAGVPGAGVPGAGVPMPGAGAPEAGEGVVPRAGELGVGAPSSQPAAPNNKRKPDSSPSSEPLEQSAPAKKLAGTDELATMLNDISGRISQFDGAGDSPEQRPPPPSTPPLPPTRAAEGTAVTDSGGTDAGSVDSTPWQDGQAEKDRKRRDQCKDKKKRQAAKKRSNR